MSRINEIANSIGDEFYDRTNGFPDSKEHDAWVARTAAIKMARAVLGEARSKSVRTRAQISGHGERAEYVRLSDLEALFEDKKDDPKT